jgi:hypothetical protein
MIQYSVVSGVHLNFPSKLAIMNVPRITGLTSLFALFVFLFWRLTSGAFTIDSSTPTMTEN